MQEHEPLTEAALLSALHTPADLTVRHLTVGGNPVVLFFLDSLTSGEDIALHVLRPLALLPHGEERAVLTACLDGTVWNAACTLCRTVEDSSFALLHGSCLLLLPSCGLAAAFETKSRDRRSPSPPDTESTVKGAKDAFTETLRVNLGLLRRHLRHDSLCLRQLTVGERSHTAVCIVSLADLTDPRLVQAVETRLRALKIEGMLTPAAVEEYLTGSRATAFPLIQFTERPDRFAQSVLDGQVGVFVDGLPLGYLLPVNVGILMTAAEDRGNGYALATAVRVLRYLALLISLLLPALYIAMAQFHPAMIPTKLLSAIIESKQNVPFSTTAEVLCLLVAFELLQEAGLHLPKAVGHTVSIVGGLVVGSAAVDARIISPTALIAVSVAGICGFAVPEQDFSAAIRIWRFVLGVCAALAGLYGMTMGALVLLVHLGTLDSCGKPYLAPFSAVMTGGALVRRRLAYRTRRDPLLRPRDTETQR